MPRTWNTVVLGLLVATVVGYLAALYLGDRAEWVPVNPDTVVAGQAVYEANCAACHGLKGEGEPDWKVQRADGTYPAPPHDASGHTWHHSDSVLLGIMRDGSAASGSASFVPRMPAWGNRLSAVELQAVLDYLKTFWGPRERDWQREVTRQESR